MPRWNLDLALELIPKYKVTHLLIIPSALHQLSNSPKLATADFSSIVSAHSGAAYLPPDLAKKFSAAIPSLKSLRQGYGMSESTLTMITNPSPGAVLGYTEAPGSCGVLVPGGQARIVRDDGSDADLNEPGHLLYKGNNVGLGYFGNDDATADTFGADGSGWLRTGDRFRSDGINFFFEERTKDTLKVSGIQVSPRELEDVLMANPAGLLIDAVVAGVSGGRTSDEKIPRAWVVLSAAAKRMDQDSLA